MPEKKEVQRRKVTGKKHQRKLNPKKKMEEVKLLGVLLAGVTVVQAELTEVMDNALLSTNPNLESLRTRAHQIRQANALATQLDAIARGYLDGLLDDLDQADEDGDN